MKFNKWTVALAAIGVVSLASAARGDEKMSQVQTALSNTTISGYVDTSAMWSPGNQGKNTAIPPYTPGKVQSDGFNLNAVDIALDKPMDESQWAAGYHVELMFGPDAVGGPLSGAKYNANGTSFDSPNQPSVSSYSAAAIRQAYITLRTPVGNGINWKVGVWDSILGYESSSDPLNPNYTRSYGYQMEPTTETGIIGTYKVNDNISFSAGVADNANGINGRAHFETQKSYLGSITLTAPDSWSWLKGATLNAGVIEADNGSVASTGNGTTSLYVGTVIPTPATALKVGAAFDYVDLHNGGVKSNSSDDSIWNIGLYGNYQFNDKLSFNLRGEYLNQSAAGQYTPDVILISQEAEEVTATVQYQLWANVLSRVELRWDHAEHGTPFDASATTGKPDHENAFLLAANLIYQF
jgi:Putative beta-barrel porin-2, OmpL-like. bbp2